MVFWINLRYRREEREAADVFSVMSGLLISLIDTKSEECIWWSSRAYDWELVGFCSLKPMYVENVEMQVKRTAVAFCLSAGHNKYCFYLVNNTTPPYTRSQKIISVLVAKIYSDQYLKTHPFNPTVIVTNFCRDLKNAHKYDIRVYTCSALVGKEYRCTLYNSVHFLQIYNW